MSPLWIVVFVLLGLALVAVIASRLELVERVRKRWRKELDKDEKAKQGAAELKKMAKDAFRNELLKALVYGVLVKTVWSWRKAPAGSFQKMVWNVALMAGIALGIWIAFRLIDARLNKSEKKLPDYREIKSESAVE